MTVEVERITESGEPREVLFRFDVPLNAPSLRWVQWEDGIYVPFEPPAVGETIRLPAPIGVTELSEPAELWKVYRQAVQRNAGR